jgi:hypothetical protein
MVSLITASAPRSRRNSKTAAFPCHAASHSGFLTPAVLSRSLMSSLSGISLMSEPRSRRRVATSILSSLAAMHSARRPFWWAPASRSGSIMEIGAPATAISSARLHHEGLAFGSAPHESRYWNMSRLRYLMDKLLVTCQHL